MRPGLSFGCLAACAIFAGMKPSDVAAQARRMEIGFTPVARAQIAVWIESANDDSVFQTLRLTQAVSFRGIGNRPGALQMNSGYRWPYGRREGVLPVWAARRVAAGGEAFGRVIFDRRESEGNASTAGSPNEPANTVDSYFCLSFDQANSDRDHLDAVTCASAFASAKGRYLTADDELAGYAEPFEYQPDMGVMRSLLQGSLYPPRRDVIACTTPNCGDHDDVRGYNEDARAVMPEIDAITMATPEGDVRQRLVFDVPDAWPDGSYNVFVEINVEGDYNDSHSAEINPTPVSPTDKWDYWARTFGYPYRGQPSVVFRAEALVRPSGGNSLAATPLGYGALHGEDGDIRSMDPSITMDPDGAPGSGADRLRLVDDARLTVNVPLWDACRRPNPPASCYQECDPETPDSCGPDLVCSPDATCVGLCDLAARPDVDPNDVPVACGGPCDPKDETSCGTQLVCAEDRRCVGRCEIATRPQVIDDLLLTRYPDRKQAHQYAHLNFTVPQSARGIARYEVRIGLEAIVDEASFERALPAVQASMEGSGLTLPVDGTPGDAIDVDFGGLLPEVHYFVGVRSYDSCNAPSEIAVGEFTTPATYFTTVSACFIATAAYGSPMAHEIGVLRAFRDRQLMTNAFGRAIVDAYYTLGPAAADVIRQRPWLRSTVRAVLRPIVAVLE